MRFTQTYHPSSEVRINALVTAARTAVVCALMLAACAAVTPAHAQIGGIDEPWRWMTFTESDGLSSRRVEQVTEAEDGTPWAVTEAGLAWYDGYRFNEIRLGTNIVRAGMRIDRGCGSAITVLVGDALYTATRNGIRPVITSGVAGAAEVSPGRWLVRWNERLYTYEAGRTTPVTVPKDLEISWIRNLRRTSSRELWLLNSHGIWKWAGGTFVRFFTPRGVLNTTYFLEKPSGRGAMIITDPVDEAGIWTWNRDEAPHREFPGYAGTVRAMDIHPDGTILAVHAAGLTHRTREGRWESMRFPVQEFISANSIRFRSNGDLWVATDHGLSYCDLSTQRWTYLTHPGMDERNVVHGIIRTRDGSTWVAHAGGVDHYAADGSMRNIASVNGHRIPIVTGLCEAPDGSIWISSGSGFTGAYRWDGKAWTHIGKDQGLAADFIHQITADRHGRLWFLSLANAATGRDTSEHGAFCLERGKFSRISTRNGLPSGRVYSFLEDSQGAQWFGTRSGLSRLRNGRWSHWFGPDAQIRYSVQVITEDKNHRIWFGGRELGLSFIDERDSAVYLSARGEFSNSSVTGLCVDARNRLWVTGTDGVQCLNNRAVLSLSLMSGLVNTNVWPVLVTDDALYLGTTGNGVAVMRLDSTLILRPRVYCEPAAFDDRTGDVTMDWTVSTWQGKGQPSLVLTRFRIDGGAWSAWSMRRQIALRGLRPGRHMIEVEPLDFFGPPAPVFTSYATVPTPALRSPYFQIPIAASIILLLAMWAYLSSRRRRLIRQLSASEQKFRSLAQSATTAIYIFQGERFVYVNTMVSTLTGFSHQELLNMNFWDVVHPDDQELLRQHGLGWHTDKEIVPRYEFRILRKDGTTRWVNFEASGIEYEGTPAVLGTVFDITARKEAEEALARSEAQFRALIENASDIIIVLNAHGRVTYVSSSVTGILGYEPGQFLGMRLAAFMHPEERRRLADGLGEIIAENRRPGILQGRLLHSDGEWHWFETRITNLLGDPTVGGIVINARDVTDRRQYEFALEHAKSSAENANRLKTEFLANMSHEIRTPLHIILGYTSLLSDTVEDPDGSLDECFTSIDQAGRRLMDTIHKIIDISRFQIDDFPLVLEQLNLSDLVRECADSLAVLAARRKLEFTVDIPGQPLYVNADRYALTHAVSNLIDNAIKYTLRGSVTVRITAENAIARVSVMDTGIGIDKDFLSQVFNIFSQERGGYGRPFEGTGLGLALCRKFVEANNGTVAVVSSKGVGSSFTISLPTLPPDRL